MARLIYISFYRLHIYLQYTWSHKVESGKKKKTSASQPRDRKKPESVREAQARPGDDG